MHYYRRLPAAFIALAPFPVHSPTEISHTRLSVRARRPALLVLFFSLHRFPLDTVLVLRYFMRGRKSMASRTSRAPCKRRWGTRALTGSRFCDLVVFVLPSIIHSFWESSKMVFAGCFGFAPRAGASGPAMISASQRHLPWPDARLKIDSWPKGLNHRFLKQ